MSDFRVIESDGLPASLMRVVCAWCKADLGAKVCAPSQVNQISHGVCPACRKKILDALRFPPSSMSEATAVQAVPTLPGIEQPLQVTRTADSAEVMNPPQVDEHAWARPAASFTFNDGRHA